jgi:hypothetical protein
MLRRVLQVAVAVVFTAWTAYWLISGRAYLYEHSLVMQQGLGGDGLQMWEIFDVKMVAAHHAIRWAAGALPAALLLRMLHRQGRTQSATEGVSEQPLAAGT